MSDGITDMHREEERKAAELVEKACKNCDHIKINMDSAYCFDCTNHSNFRPTQSAIDAKVEELRSKEEMSMHYKKDDLEIDMEAREDELKFMVEHPRNGEIIKFLINMYKTINPKSYLSMTFTYGEEYELLIQRKVGKTPAEKAASLERDNAEMLEVLKEYSVLKPLDAIGIIDGVCKLHNKTQKLIEKVEGK